MATKNNLEASLANAWDQNMARSNMERWLFMCEKHHLERFPENQNLLVMLFGASWYFARFVFFHGDKIKPIFDNDFKLKISSAKLCDSFYLVLADEQPELQFEALRIFKNEIMLSIFLVQLSKTHTQEEIEKALTNLADAVLLCAFRILVGNDSKLKENIAIIAMGRMAGHEMNFGSDLDLIFLYLGDDPELGFRVSTLVRCLMRNMGALSPSGLLYEMDTRLRPHGNAGVLVTGLQSFINYHQDEREIWERQMMTHCRVVVDYGDIADVALGQLKYFVYQPFLDNVLKSEITSMRKLIIDELSNQQGEYDVKRGEGGIMDIDFLAHYLQLAYGHDNESLHVTSTREALRILTEQNKMQQDISKYLLQAYDYLKNIESCLRVFDMKAINRFVKAPEKISRLARSMGYMDKNIMVAGKDFLAGYVKRRQGVRQIFNNILDV